MMKALYESLVRTYVPWLAGVILGWLVSLGIPLDPEVETQVTLVIMAAASILYYVAVRLFETYISPRIGWLLGWAKQPVYDAPAAKAQSEVATVIATDQASSTRQHPP